MDYGPLSAILYWACIYQIMNEMLMMKTGREVAVVRKTEMHRGLQCIIPTLLLMLNTSCAEQPTLESELWKVASISNSQNDKLHFRSGIRAILQDRRGNYWFGSLQEGVAVYDGTSFRYFTSADGLTDNQIHDIQEDKDGNIWFTTQTGLSSFDGTRIIQQTTNRQKAQPAFYLQKDNATSGKWMKSDDELWFEAGVSPGVYRYDGHQLNYLEFPPQNVRTAGDNLYAVTDISKGRKVVWFATYAAVLGYDGDDFKIIDDARLDYDRKVQSLHIRSVLEDTRGRLWIGNNGIGVLLMEGDSLIQFSEKYHLMQANSKRNGEPSPRGTMEHVFTIAEDRLGNIWFGDRDAGIWKYDGKHLENYTNGDGLTNDFVLSIFEDRNNELWFGMADGSVYTFNGKSFEKQF